LPEVQFSIVDLVSTQVIRIGVAVSKIKLSTTFGDEMIEVNVTHVSHKK